MTTKLTKHMKDTIKDIVMEKAGLGYDSNKECAEKKDWAERVRISALGGEIAAKEVDDFIKAVDTSSVMKSVAGWVVNDIFKVTYRSGLVLDIDGAEVNVAFNGDKHGQNYNPVMKPSPRSHCIHREDPLAVEFYERMEIDTKVSRERYQISEELGHVMTGVTTIEQLVKKWPECKSLLPAEWFGEKDVAIVSLNSVLSL